MAVPMPVPGVDGSFYLCVDGVTVSALTWLDAKPWSQLSVNPQMYFELGCELAKMHTLADAWTLPAGFTRPNWDLVGENPSWDRFWENPMLTSTQAHRLLTFRDAARIAIDQLEPLDKGLIHADLIPDNVLYTTRNELKLIDFDDGGFGYRLFDLATITWRCRCIQPDGALATATVEGYCANQNIDNQSIDQHALRLFEALRACTYVGWNITRIDEPSGQQRNVRYIQEAMHAIEIFSTSFQSKSMN